MNIVIIISFNSKNLEGGEGVMKKIWKKVVVFALVALRFVISTVGNLTLWPGKGGK